MAILENFQESPSARPNDLVGIDSAHKQLRESLGIFVLHRVMRRRPGEVVVHGPYNPSPMPVASEFLGTPSTNHDTV